MFLVCTVEAVAIETAAEREGKGGLGELAGMDGTSEVAGGDSFGMMIEGAANTLELSEVVS